MQRKCDSWTPNLIIFYEENNSLNLSTYNTLTVQEFYYIQENSNCVRNLSQVVIIHEYGRAQAHWILNPLYSTWMDEL